ncbi:bis(5'-nucleosyl)-tetraphosphatase (symmetrical) YqeK [Listeria sp. PSOL-1]|uniref:bis(5'-nucleosyl)-tetraphosphatase (symmetrical) YqeK n=1 Tax=Listeria sp. PSOL-1 TaxID=1844999 RepID=UPI0013D6BE01|nr:bis(5'-nucleosyl)-tetraphosphatase (symmetrical) YqeK [Listeria sp. PSOL-1]
MKRTEMLEKVKQAMPEKRYLHSLGVETTAIHLAEHYNIPTEKASIAGILHDYAKYYSNEHAKEVIINQKLDPRLLDFHPSIWHGPVGSYLIQQAFAVTDPEIIEAIRVHTTGKAAMSTLDKIIYLADYTEPGRDFPGVDKARELVEKSLDDAMLYALEQTMIFLAGRNSLIFPDTLDAYNDFVRKKIKELS